MANTIMLKLSNAEIRKEGVASGAVRPGAFVDFGGANDVQQAAAGSLRRTIAVENDLVGGGIADDYATGETVQYIAAVPGEEYQCWLADGENVVKGAHLVIGANGSLVAQPSGDEALVRAIALEDVNASGADARIIVEVV